MMTVLCCGRVTPSSSISCEKHGWDDLWPSDLVTRARVNQYLHFHHRNTRELVIRWSQTIWPCVYGEQNPDADWIKHNTFPGLPNNAELRLQTLQIIDGMLSRSRFIATDDHATLADISAYEEIGQNQPKFANCDDYGPYPNIRRWLVDMEQLPGFDAVHEVWRLIGDVGRIEGGMRTIVRANKLAAEAIRKAAVNDRPITAHVIVRKENRIINGH